MKEEFVEFLKKHKAYRKFCKNLKANRWGKRPAELIDFGFYNVSIAFVWNNTPEGYNYWDELDKKWREWLTQK